MDEQRLVEIETRMNAATAGPWRRGQPNFRCVLDHGVGRGGHGQGGCRYTYTDWWDYPVEISVDGEYALGTEKTDEPTLIAGMWDYEEGGIQRTEDADFMAHARQDIPALIAEVRRLQNELSYLKAGQL